MALFNKVKKTFEEATNSGSIKIPAYFEAKERCYQAITKDTGMSREEAISLVREIKNRIKISYTDFRKNEFWKLTAEEQENKFKELNAAAKELEEKKNAQTVKAEDKYIKLVCEQSGLDYDTARAKMEAARKRRGCKFVEYYWYGFYNKTDEEQDTYFLGVDAHKIRDRYNNKLVETITANKSVTDTIFKNYISRNWCRNKEIDLEGFKKLFSKTEKIIYKPLLKSAGMGIKTYDISPENIDEVYRELIGLDLGMIEEYLIQHEGVSALYGGSINTLRFVTISWVDSTGFHYDMPYSAIRIGNGTIVDNVHMGGLCAGIDLDTGVISTDAYDGLRNVYKEHPITGCTIKGHKIPFFEEAKYFVANIVSKYQLTGQVGWDIAITKDGPELIEMNSKPAAELLQSPLADTEQGVIHIMKKYIG